MKKASFDTQAAAGRAQSAIETLRRAADELKIEFDSAAAELARYEDVDLEALQKFLKEPWCILPKSRTEWWVIVPRWVGLSVGFLERATETYNIFRVDRYSHWFGTVPEQLREQLKLPDQFQATVEGNELRTTAQLPPAVQKHLAEKTGEGTFRITRGHEFDIIAALVEAGSLPFTPRPVAAEDLRDVKLQGLLTKPRPYQSVAWNYFLETGAVLVCWPFGMGKTFLGLYAIAHLKGPKLIVVPSTTLVEQWEKRLVECLELGLRSDVTVCTYHAWAKIKDRDWTLVIFDEAHYLPASTFSRMSTLRTKYRIGLTATPYREDGRESYVVALSGYPVGVDWVEFIRSGLIKKPDIEVRIVSGPAEKARACEVEARGVKGSVFIFCDGLAFGASIARRMGIPHVHGDTKERLKIIESNRVVVLSRVGDEGLSVPDLRKTIEVDYLGGSRRQESQRVGRLFHTGGKGEHLCLMTRDEFDRFQNRFLALEEKGFKVTVREKG